MPHQVRQCNWTAVPKPCWPEQPQAHPKLRCQGGRCLQYLLERLHSPQVLLKAEALQARACLERSKTAMLQLVAAANRWHSLRRHSGNKPTAYSCHQLARGLLNWKPSVHPALARVRPRLAFL